MSCKDFEEMLADALGGELSGVDRARFDGHVAMCETCRAEYESLVGAVGELRSLPAGDSVSTAVARHAGSRRAAPAPLRMGAVYRYAASVLIAFGAGYVMRGAPATSAESVKQAAPTRMATSKQRTLETVIASAYREKPAGMSLSTAMSAILSPKQ